MTRDRMHALVSAWAVAVARNDVAALETMVSPPLREGVLGRTRGIHAAFRDIAIVPMHVVIEGGLVAWRYRMTGVHVAPLAGIAATLRVTALDGVNFQRVCDGVVVEHWTTVDLSPLRA